MAYHEIADVKQNGFPDDLDLVAISTFTAQFHEAVAVADHYRSRGVPVVMGGITVSALADEALQHCTSVVIGEGEPLWLEVLGDFERGTLKPRYVQSRPGQFDLLHAPLPRFDLLDPARYNRITVQTSRAARTGASSARARSCSPRVTK